MTGRELSEDVEAFQNMLISYATGGTVEESAFQRARAAVFERLRDKTPRFVRVNRDLKQLWAHFKQVSGTYQGRREYIWNEFGPIFGELEGANSAPPDDRVTDTLAVLNSDAVKTAWVRSLERRADEPEGAITSARTLLETVCKHMLDDARIEYPADADLPKLYRMTAELLDLAPGQQSEPILRQILGGCTAVVEGIGALRNKLGDAHGRGRDADRVEARHASLAVNLAGATATFLVEAWEASKGTTA
jgi:Abortive infection C-terminus